MGAVSRSLPRPRLALPRPPARGTLIRLVIALVVLAIGGLLAFQLWFKHSSFVAADTVRVAGADERPDVAVALEQAGRGQSTLAVDLAALEAAVAGDPAVAGIAAHPDFPKTLEIEVELRTPAGFLAGGGAVVAGDGVVLERTEAAPDGVPRIVGEGARGGSARGETREVARVLGAAPAELLAEVSRAKMTGDHGVVAEVGPGIELRFGARTAPRLKWEAAAAVLADRKLDSAAYLDLSVPRRPVAGTLE
jgi:type II secretory pathway pseudopilin PulG